MHAASDCKLKLLRFLFSHLSGLRTVKTLTRRITHYTWHKSFHACLGICALSINAITNTFLGFVFALVIQQTNFTATIVNCSAWVSEGGRKDQYRSDTGCIGQIGHPVLPKILRVKLKKGKSNLYSRLSLKSDVNYCTQLWCIIILHWHLNIEDWRKKMPNICVRT